MTTRGTLKVDGLAVAKIDIDFLQNPVKVHALAALVHHESGQTLGWTDGDGAVFSSETMRKVQELRDAMEQDIARRICTEYDTGTAPTAGTGVRMGGLGEHLGEQPEAASI